MPVDQPEERPDLSIVIPLYNEEETFSELYRRVTNVAEQLQLRYELIFVNDGSSDATATLLDDVQSRDPWVVVLHLSRNFGHQPAVCAGLDASTGSAVIVMDGDLQDPPELVPTLLQRWREGHEVVYAVRRSRQEGLLQRAGYWLFYRLLRIVSELPIPLDSGDFCLMDRRVVDILCHLPERLRFVRGLRTFVGFRQCGVAYDRPARLLGQSKYSFRALVRLGLDGLINFSTFPLKLITMAGLVSMGVALTLGVWLCGEARSNSALPISLAVSVSALLVIAAGQFLGQGILGEYVRRIFLECKGRPTYLISRRQAQEKAPSPPVTMEDSSGWRSFLT